MFWSKMIFSYSLAFDTPVNLGGGASGYCYTVWYGKTRMVWLYAMVNSVMFSRFDRYRRVTDGRTSCDIIVRAMHSIAR